MAFGPVNAGGGATGSTMEEIYARIWAARQEAENALKEHADAENPHGITTEAIGAVPVARTINGKALDRDVTLGAVDVGAVPVSRKINGKALISDITLTAQDVGALSNAFFVGTSAPSDAKLLWIDTTANTGGLKYHNGTAWVHVPVSTT